MAGCSYARLGEFGHADRGWCVRSTSDPSWLLADQYRQRLSVASQSGICDQLVWGQPGWDISPLERPRYGFFVDHTVDAFNEVLIFLGLGLSPYIRFQIASLALIGYLLMSVLVYVRTAVTGEFRISYGRLGPTEVRVIAILANMLIFFFGNPAIGIPWGTITIFELVAALIAGILFLIFIFSTLQEARNLAKHE
jgi:hypothetical protein